MSLKTLNPYDLFDVRSLLSEEERAVQDSVARFTDERVLPIIGDCFDQGRFPDELIPEIADMGLLGSTLPEQYGGSGLNGVSYGLICQELERGDSGLRLADAGGDAGLVVVAEHHKRRRAQVRQRREQLLQR